MRSSNAAHDLGDEADIQRAIESCRARSWPRCDHESVLASTKEIQSDSSGSFFGSLHSAQCAQQPESAGEPRWRERQWVVSAYTATTLLICAAPAGCASAPFTRTDSRVVRDALELAITHLVNVAFALVAGDVGAGLAPLVEFVVHHAVSQHVEA
jgi:hypothetical protein